MPFIGQIAAFAFTDIPKGWMQCQGQMLQVQQYPVLFSLISNRFGGDGVTSFALPDLSGRAGIGLDPNNGIRAGLKFGTEQATVPVADGQNLPILPAHSHPFNVTTAIATSNSPAGNQFATAQKGNPVSGGAQAKLYAVNSINAQLWPESIAPAGGGGPHNNMQPYLAINYCIAIQGDTPPRH